MFRCSWIVPPRYGCAPTFFHKIISKLYFHIFTFSLKQHQVALHVMPEEYKNLVSIYKTFKNLFSKTTQQNS